MNPATVSAMLILCTILGMIAGWLARGIWRSKAGLQPWQIDPDQQCPACGHSRGSIKFDESLRMILHACGTCGATWGEPTVVKVADWRQKSREPEPTNQWL